MFKYFWIIILVIAALAFIGYTIYAIKDVISSADEKDTLVDLWDDFVLCYEELVMIWIIILIITCIASLIVWAVSTFGG